MATPTIPNGEEYFFNILYEGNGGGQRVGKFVPFTDNGTIDNSCLFNDGDSPSLARTPSSGGDRRTWTFSAWIKRGNLTGAVQYIFSASDSASSTKYDYIYFDTDNTIDIQHYNGSGTEGRIKTNRTFEDTSKFYHLFYVFDSTNATAGNRMRLYIDGDEITSFSIDTNPSLNYETDVNDTTPQTLGKPGWASAVFFDGYMAEVNLVDGTALTPSTFGVTDTSTGRWIPKTLSGITYGTNGFRLKFQDSSALGDDTSGNGNDLSATNLSSTNQTTDSPTQNHATINPNTASNGSMTFAQGNLNVEMNNAYPGNVLGTLGASSGKYYWEVTISGTGSSANGYATGVAVAEWSKLNSDPQLVTSPFSSYIDSRSIFVHNGATVSNSTTFTAGDVISIALNLDDSEISYFKNNTIVGSAQPLVEGQTYFPFFKNSTTVADLRYTPNFGQRSWNYTPPTDFVALQQDNLPETAKGISGLVWTKDRDNAYNHGFWDSSRGGSKYLVPNTTGAEGTATDGVQKFLKGGFSVEDTTGVNSAGDSKVAWNWVANGGTTASNTDGSITSTVQANTTAGFSIVQYTGTGSNATVGHGLSSAPELIILKRLNGVQDWLVGNTASGWTKHLFLNGTDALATASTTWNNTAPTSSVFSVGTANSSNKSGDPFIGYVWHGVDGFSKIGSYTGNGNADGPFIYTGFRPAWVMYKQTNTTNYWAIFDSKRSPHNVMQNRLAANYANVEDVSTANQQDFLSNGFKLRGTDTTTNQSGGTYIYMAFAEHPFVGDGTNPVTAR